MDSLFVTLSSLATSFIRERERGDRERERERERERARARERERERERERDGDYVHNCAAGHAAHGGTSHVKRFYYT